MAYTVKPLACDPARIKGMSEKLLVSHYENNYGGAVNRLNAITAQLAELDFAKAPGFVINGLKREELIASNSMSCSSPRSVTRARRKASCATRSPAISGASIAGGLNSLLWAKRRAAVRVGCC
jgi:hypothetical protein